MNLNWTPTNSCDPTIHTGGCGGSILWFWIVAGLAACDIVFRKKDQGGK